jgi:hypothetical protein
MDGHRHHLVHYWGVVVGRRFVDCPESFAIYGTSPGQRSHLRLLSIYGAKLSRVSDYSVGIRFSSASVRSKMWFTGTDRRWTD